MNLPEGMLPVPYPFRSPFSLPTWVLAIPERQWQDFPVRLVSLDRITATKTGVLLGSVAAACSAVQQGQWDRSQPSGRPCLPLGFEDEAGVVSLTDGHHRLVATGLCGYSKMPMRLVGPSRPAVIEFDPRTPYIAGVLAAQHFLSRETDDSLALANQVLHLW